MIRRGRLRWLAAIAGAGAITAAMWASVVSLSAASASPPSAAPSSVRLTGVTPRILAEYGVKLAAAPASAANNAKTSEGAAVALARSQPMVRSTGVRQAVVAQVTFTSSRPAVTGLYWVVSLKPTGDVPIFGGPHTAHPKIRSTYFVVFINAATGRFFAAMVG
jgi:hypothetical protein